MPYFKTSGDHGKQSQTERLEQYINDVHKKHLTEVFIFHLLNHFYTNLYTQLHF